MAKAKGQGEKRGEDRRKGRAPISASGPTRPSTFRISPGGLASIRELSDRLSLGSQAGAIETATATLLDSLNKCDIAPPVSDGQLKLAVAAVREARIVPRSLGPTGRFNVVLLAAIMTYETTAVPAECTAGEYAALIDAVRQFTAAESLWLMAKAVGE